MEVVFEHCVSYTRIAAATAVLSSQDQFQVTAGCLWHQKNDALGNPSISDPGKLATKS
jgi:hypothetical protein